ncbi:4Fe-4S dicluster domain-containing protein [candidate division KSB3 bacterium]|uniref:4Fe-4S dicluster domain-containing protein n=1 Tax=candidate division KSB3 bacterium TaxID=2044937 RepID=A0A9D5JXN1_9BACT|nr:4Fe-4S dicluster domain-containing protein [candidate division KSB3 bacterium]MBD3326058.1 4Fe-4S dicluster domain-containing protein [candidate division KSB3 bacterium]
MKYFANVSTLEFYQDKCTGCGRCLEVCPHAVFAMNNGTAVVQDNDRCIECGACMQNCAFGAIYVDAGVGCATAIINGMMRGEAPSCGCGSSSGSCCC